VCVPSHQHAARGFEELYKRKLVEENSNKRGHSHRSMFGQLGGDSSFSPNFSQVECVPYCENTKTDILFR
jgi:hypothetical protein